MTVDELREAKVLVVGLGRSGMAALELLCREGAHPAATDVKPLDEMPEIAARLAQLGVPHAVQSPDVFLDRSPIILSPGVPADLPELAAVRERGAQVIGELELASEFLQGSTIGITGSNGKTTTTALTGHILEQAGVPVQVGGNIGNPPTNMVSGSRSGQWNVLELSSFQLETIQQFRTPVAAVLNITPDHLDRHHTMEQYIAAKARILETQTSADAVILNANDEQCRKMADAARGRVVWFSSTGAVDDGVWIHGDAIVHDGEALMNLADIPLRGLHNAENVMAAAVAARLAGVPLNAIAEAVRTFPGVEHRLEFVRTLDGVDYFNDSKATNVDATLKALDAFSGGLWVILGGKDKGSDYSVLRPPLASKARAALLVGAASSKIAEHLGDAVETVDCQTIDGAMNVARRRAEPGDTVLLAPACASFDQFVSYEQRGRSFKRLVNGVASKGDSPEEAREESCA